MHSLDALEIETLCIVLAWTVGVIAIYKKAKSVRFIHLPEVNSTRNAQRLAECRRVRDHSILVSLVAAALIGVAYAIWSGGWGYFIDFVVGGMLVGFALGSILVRQVGLKGTTNQESGTSAEENLQQAKPHRKKPFLIYLAGVVGICSASIWYYIHGESLKMTLFVAITIFLIFLIVYLAVLSRVRKRNTQSH